MRAERFNELLDGALYHPSIPCRINRLALALRFVVQATGEAGERALEECCSGRAERDAKYAAAGGRWPPCGEGDAAEEWEP